MSTLTLCSLHNFWMYNAKVIWKPDDFSSFDQFRVCKFNFAEQMQMKESTKNCLNQTLVTVSSFLTEQEGWEISGEWWRLSHCKRRHEWKGTQTICMRSHMILHSISKMSLFNTKLNLLSWQWKWVENPYNHWELVSIYFPLFQKRGKIPS